jgi:error-prone DNA polymerase
VQFCKRNGIVIQRRGSAANSAVCYALEITIVDSVGMDLLFERFLSESRNEWPDIDLDLPSEDKREQAIQYVYRRYGELGAAMTATSSPIARSPRRKKSERSWVLIQTLWTRCREP